MEFLAIHDNLLFERNIGIFYFHVLHKLWKEV